MADLVGGSVVWNFKVETKQFDADLKRASNQTKQFGATTTEAGNKASKSFGSVVKSGVALLGTAAVLQKVKSFAVDAISAFGQFESNLGLLQSVTTATNSQLEQMKQLSIDLGNDLSLPGISAADAASAMIELGKAGLGVNDVLGATKGVLQGAKAGNIDFGQSATLVANALQVFRLEGSKATKVADLFAAAANASSAEVGDVGFALQMSASQAAQLNIPLDATVGLIAQLANQGIRGSDAGTSLKTMFQRLVPNTKKAKEAMKDLGVDVFDATGKFIGIRPTIAKFGKALGKLTQEQRQQTLYTIFGSDAIRAASIITRDGVKGFDKMREAVNREGAAADLAASRNRGIKGSLDALKSSFETIQLSVGEFLSKALKPVVQLLSKNLEPALIGLAAGVTVLGIAAGIVAAPLIAMVAPILAIAAVAALVAGGVAYLQKRFDIFGKSIDFVKRAILFLKDSVLTPMIEFLKGVGTAVADAATAGFGFMKDRINDVIGALKSVKEWILDHQDGLKQIAGVITLILGPAFIKLAAQATATMLTMVYNATLTGTAWASAAIASAAAWTLSFITMSIKAAAHAIVSGFQAAIAGGKWVFWAAASAVAWVAKFALMSARAIATAVIFVAQAAIAGWAWILQAGKASVAWVASFATTKGAFLALTGLIASPVVMGAIIIAAALASLATIWKAIQSVRQAITDVNNASSAAESRGRAESSAIKTINEAYKAGKITKAERSRKINDIAGNAQGTNNWRGGWTWLGEKGPELVNLPKGSQVIPSSKSKQMAGGSQVTVNIDMKGIMTRSRGDLREITKDMLRAVNEELRSKGVAPLGEGAI